MGVYSFNEKETRIRVGKSIRSIELRERRSDPINRG